MNDKERLLALLQDFGVTPKAVVTGHHVRLMGGYGGVQGFEHIYCDFAFDEEGEFVEAAVWE